MGRILFLSTVAFLAYRYISKSNQRHQSLPAGETKGALEILPPTTSSLTSPSTSAIRSAATEPVPHPRLIPTTSRAAEADPVR
jgi:hypothetical protein